MNKDNKKIEFLYEDEQIIVCYKPAGIPVQTKRMGQPDMESILRNHLKGSYVGVIHRLDQPVEGLLVFAKTPVAAGELNRQLQGAGFGKFYRAILLGIPSMPSGELIDYMVKDGKSNTSRICESGEPGAKKAVLAYEVTETWEEEGQAFSKVKVKLQTGRHHQIRLQMAHMGCPIVGDMKYGTEQEPQKGVQGGKLMLCAYRLEFIHPKTGKKMEFEI